MLHTISTAATSIRDPGWGEGRYFEGLDAFEDDLVLEIGKDLGGDFFDVCKVCIPRCALSLLILFKD